MRVSQGLDYALRALVLLAARPAGERVTAGDLADRLGLPRRFVEQQFTALSHAGIVECRRGPGGGCALARPARAVSVLDVVRVIDGAAADVPNVTGSAVSGLWGTVAENLDELLASTSIDTLAQRQRELDAAHASMYWI